MKIAIIGSGNVGSALAKNWAKRGHQIFLGVRDQQSFKGKDLLSLTNISAHSIMDAVQMGEIILLATPATSAVEVATSLGDTNGKIIIDTMNVVMGRGPVGFANTTEAILKNTNSKDIAKCFNTTGAENLLDPQFPGVSLDLFVAGDSIKAKEIAQKLAKDAGFENCYDIGGNDKFSLLESFANFWINLAVFQGYGRNIGFKLLNR